MSLPTHHPNTVQKLIQATAISLCAGFVATLPARSAEEIYFDFGSFGRSLPVSSLEAFAESGVVDDQLAPFLKAVPSDRQEQFQSTLSTSIIPPNSGFTEQFNDPFVLSQWLYTPLGESVLVRVGELIQTEGRQNGQYALRSAMVLAAADPGGLSLLNLIRFYPTGGIRLNLPQILALRQAVSTNREITEALLLAAAQTSAANAAREPSLDYGALPVLAENGPFEVEQRSRLLTDPERNRTFPVDLYLPANLSAVAGPIPVMVLSHGYGDMRTNSEAIEFAQALAAHGFVVALPEHIGSNKAYQNALSLGLTQSSFEVMEFVNRPLDIRFLLDTLEQQNETEFQGRLQLDRVGLIGHSFGGYTALATAGATVDFERLTEQCSLDGDITHDQVNIALALQCRALELNESPDIMQQLTDGSLADDRIGLVFTLSPVSSLFGAAGMGKIQVPTVIMGGALDIASPVALEQVAAFQGLTTAQKYLYLAENLSHTPDLTRMALEVTDPNRENVERFNETEELFTDLMISLAIAHGKVALLNDESYRPYLTSAYVEAVSVEPTRLHLVRSAPAGF